MSDQREKDHWRELAELLGLPADDKSAASRPPASPVQRDNWPAEPRPDHFEPVTPFEAAHEDIVEEEAPLISDSVNEELASEGPRSEPLPSEPLASESPDEDVRSEPPEDRDRDDSSGERPRRGRRRGRRGQKNDAPPRDRPALTEATPSMEQSPEQLALDEDQSQPESASEDAGADSGRGRGRRRKSDESTRRDTMEDEGAELDDVQESPADKDDDDEVDKLTDWNVPSWTELIGSLYRPER
jgi:hypothetical protein